MRPYRLLLAVLLFLVPVIRATAQEKSPFKFGRINPEDFDLSKYKFDPGASAVIIADVGNSSFEGTNKGWFALVFKRQMRIKILNKNGFDAANVEIPLYFDGDAEEELEGLKAFTYNLEGGKVVETKFAANTVFKDKLSKNKMVKKFTFPAVREGSIIEYSYSIKSDFLFNLQSWSFQGEYPRIWSEYEVRIPAFFRYVFLAQGYNPFHIEKKTTSFENYTVGLNRNSSERREIVDLRETVNINRWVMMDVPAIKEESFTSTLDNHISRIQFQLSEYQIPLAPKTFLGNWVSANKDLMEHQDFGAPLDNKNNWLDDDIKNLIAGTSSALEKARCIYAYVRDNFSCTGYGRYLSKPLATVFKSRTGNVADINLLLIAMLHHEKIESNPILLSTKRHGFTNEFYPLMFQYNYVIAETRIGPAVYYLDATHALGFNRLASDCYNGHARVFGSVPRAVYFDSDSLIERKNTFVFIANDEASGLTGRMQSVLGYYESVDVREKIKAKGEKDFFKSIKPTPGMEMAVTGQGIDSLKLLEEPVKLFYDFSMKLEEDLIYFNPVMAEGYHENYFKAADRKYPIEMPYVIDETFILNMEIPKGYVVEEIPKSARVAFNEDEGLFSYLIEKDGERIQLLTSVKLKKAYFLPEDYASLREFFGYIVKKHSEQIVFKKKKT